jgi:predicted O-methyltransferase YrrM
VPDNVFVEIGTYMGLSAGAIALGCTESGARLVTIDHFRGNPEHGIKPSMELAEANLVSLGIRHMVDIVKGDAIAIAKCFAEPVHALYINSEHAQAAVLMTFGAWNQHLVNGGHVLFHDSAVGGWPEVVKAVDFIATAYNLTPIGGAYSIRHFKKP